MKAKFFQLLEEMNNADPKFSLKAFRLLCFYMPNQGADYITHNDYISYITGMNIDTIRKAKKELKERGVIYVEPAYTGKENNRLSGTYVTVKYEWKAKGNEHGKNEPILNEPILNEPILNEPILNEHGKNEPILNEPIYNKQLIEKRVNERKDLPRENDPQGKDLTREKGEGAAAKPPPAPALSEGAENVPEKSAAQNAPGAASQESSFPETAQGQQNGNKYQVPLSVPEVMKQGQTDLFGEAAPLPEKPKKERKAKTFTPPTKEEVRLELESLLAKKGTIQQWSDNDLRAMTEKFFEHYNTRNWEKSNGQKLKDWRASLNTTWLLKQGYLPDRTTRNQPQREGKQIFTAEQLEKLVAGNTDPQQILEQRRERENQKGNVITIE